MKIPNNATRVAAYKVSSPQKYVVQVFLAQVSKGCQSNYQQVDTYYWVESTTSNPCGRTKMISGTNIEKKLNPALEKLAKIGVRLNENIEVIQAMNDLINNKPQ